MAVDGHLNFDTKIDESGFNSGISKLSGLAKSGAAAAATALAGVTAALGGGVVAGVKYNATIEQYQTSFEVMTGSAEKAEQMVKQLTDLGAKTPFEMTGLADTTQLLMQYGFTADEAISQMMMLGDISQGSADKMNRIAMAYGQMSSAVKVQLEDVKQMIEAGFNPLQEISESTGESMSSLYDRISKGTLSVDEITASMERSTSAGGKYFQSMEKQSQTVSGQLSTLKDNAMQLLGSLTSGISSVLGEDILPAVNEMLGSLNDAFQDGGFQGFLDELGTAVPALQGATNAIGTLVEKLQGMSTSELKELGVEALKIGAAVPAMMLFATGLSGIVSASQGVKQVAGGMISSLGKMPSALSSLGKSAKSAGPAFDELRTGIAQMGLSIKNNDAAKLMGASLKGGASQAKTGIAGILNAVKPFSSLFISSLGFAAIAGAAVAGLGILYSEFGGEIDQLLLMVQTKGPEIITNFCNGITQKLPFLIAQGATLIQNLLSAITANIPALVSGGVQIISGLVTGIAQQLPQLIPAALQMILTLVQALISNAPQLISAGLQLILGLAQGIINAIPQLLSAIPEIIQALVSGISQSLPQIILAGIQLIVMLVTGIIQAIPQLLAAIPEIFSAFVDGISSVDWLSVGKQILTAIADGIVSIGSSLWDAVKGIFSGGEEEAAAEGKKAGAKYAEGLGSTTVNAQTSAMNVANATTTSFATGLTAGSFQANAASMQLGRSAYIGLQASNTSESFGATGQNAAMNLANGINLNSYNAMAAGMNIGSSANMGVDSSNMSGSYSAAGAQAGQSLSTSLAGQSGNVAAAAGVVSSSASGVDLSGAYANAGSQAMQSMAGAISSGSGTVTSAATSAANAAIQGMTNVNISAKAKTEGQNFYKSLADAIKSGAGTARAAVTSLMNSVKTAATGLGSSGQTLGLQFSNGLAAGIRSGGGGVSAAAAQVAQEAVRAAQANLQVNSPSRIGIWLGEMFDLGLGRGLKLNTPVVLSGMKYMTNSLSAETSRALSDMQKAAVLSTTTTGVAAYKNMQVKRAAEQTDYTGILNEWERRQKKINRERDDRPIILSGRQINRTKNKKGDIKS